jgi:hypothetical protein
MRRWAPWLVAFIVWNGAFDLQVREAGVAFTNTQLDRWRRQQPLELLRDAFTPQVRTSALRATALAGVVLLGGLALTRRTAAAAHR